MSTSGIRAEMPSGAVWDDPSEDLLFELLSDVERGDEEFIVVVRLETNVPGDHYVQAILEPDGGWTVEHRHGDATTHERGRVGPSPDDKRLLHQVIVSWAYDFIPFDAPAPERDWREAVQWRSVTA